MFNKASLSKILIGSLILVLFAIPQLSYADWSIGLGIGDHHDDRDRRHDDRVFFHYHDHPHYGLHMHFLPDGYFTVWAGGVRYYYYDGLYYSYVGNGDYVLVAPPAGIIVTTIPSDFQQVSINGATYYVNGGAYYLYTQHGYQVVAQPPVVVKPAPVVVVQPSVVVVNTQDSFPVNVPNDKGGYTTVVIKKSDKGFLGPQGEFYAEFPKVSQLKAMYSK